MNTELTKKSVHDLRVMAQAFGVTDIFEKDASHLIQEIEIKQQKMVPSPIPLPPLPMYDSRLMTKPPSRIALPTEMTEILEPYISSGLKVKLDHESWTMNFGNKQDTGPMRMPLRHVIEAARRIMA